MHRTDMAGLIRGNHAKHPQPHRHAAAESAGPPGQHGGVCHTGYCQGWQPAHQPPQGGHPCVPGRAVCGRSGKKGRAAFVFKRAAPARNRAGDEDHSGAGTVSGVLPHRADYKPRFRGLRTPCGPWVYAAGGPCDFEHICVRCRCGHSHRAHTGQPVRRLFRRV